MAEITLVLSLVERGTPHAAEDLLPLVYDEFRKLAAHRMAREKPGNTLPPTALVHEAYIRLVDAETPQRWKYPVQRQNAIGPTLAHGSMAS